MADVTTKTKRLTVDEYMALPDRYAEIVNGELVTMSPNQRGPVLVARRLFVSLYLFAQEHGLGEVLQDGATYLLDAEDRTDWVDDAYLPDVSFVSRQRYDEHNAQYGETDGPWRLAPDLAIEVVSPTDRYTIINRKVVAYLQHGVRLVWVIDPQARTIKVHTPDDPDGKTFHEADDLDASSVLPGWSMPVGEVIGEPPEAAEDE